MLDVSLKACDLSGELQVELFSLHPAKTVLSRNSAA